jgi:RimJ/RimL family protein N-acetyltransferase
MSGPTTVSAQVIHAARVRLRPARDGDVEGFVETQIDQRVRRFLGGPRPEADVRAMVAAVGVPALTSQPGQYIVADATNDAMLGTILLTRRPLHLPGHLDAGSDELELIYVFRHDAQGRGLATEAARAILGAASAELPDQPVLIVTQSANGPSLSLAKRLGFTTVETFEQFGVEQTLLTASLASFPHG